MKIISSNIGYGYGLYLSTKGVHIIINGFIVRFYKSLHTEKWVFNTTENAWRKGKNKINDKLSHEMP